MSYLIIMKKYGYQEEAKPTGDIYYFKNADQKKAKVKMLNDLRLKEDRSRNDGYRFSAKVCDSKSDLYEKASRQRIINNLYDRSENSSLRPEHRGWLIQIMSKYREILTEHLQDLYDYPPEFETHAEEYISISMHSSTWTSYVTGKKEIDGIVYEVTTSYDSKSNRV